MLLLTPNSKCVSNAPNQIVPQSKFNLSPITSFDVRLIEETSRMLPSKLEANCRIRHHLKDESNVLPQN